MRWICLFAVAMTALGCKDKEGPRAVEQRPAAPAGSGAPPAAPAPGPAATSAPAMPRLDPAVAGAEFASEVEDKAWAAKTEAAIKAAVPELTEVDCKQRQCRATLQASSEKDLVSRADKLGEQDSLRGTGARNVLLTAPVTTDGKLSMKIYVRYDR